jgi:hypothetical protein
MVNLQHKHSFMRVFIPKSEKSSSSPTKPNQCRVVLTISVHKKQNCIFFDWETKQYYVHINIFREERSEGKKSMPANAEEVVQFSFAEIKSWQ